MDQNKTDRLDSLLTDLRSFVVAFSGGLDSSYLVYHASRLKNIRFIAVTIRTPYMPAREINEAVEFATVHGIDHKIIDIS
ncbi:MAG: ATP-utilizing enzyme (PP-loop superfamily), partial [Bacteroidetes bacterium]|nr:ATP-utilizing enzyme (PP-loop superfamily) [Bacteroidota bacterium]